MKITIGAGSVIEEEGGSIRLDSAVISMYSQGATPSKTRLVFAYCLRPGEQIRRVSENEYEVIF